MKETQWEKAKMTIIEMYEKEGYSPVEIATALELNNNKVMAIIKKHFYPNGF
tara:strand:+ start:7825 stop:7980 length:156 start_codon:yes stop_codon:yes gene_type:complete